jgi:SPP1 gp7 family putative phage head morphogenesis protein
VPRRRKRKSFVDLVREVGSLGRLRDLSRRRLAEKKRRALAPTDPAAALAQMKSLGVRFAKKAEALLATHVLPNLGNPAALEAGIAVFGRELDAAASTVRATAASAGKKAVRHAKTEYERIARAVLPKDAPARAEQFASIVELRYQKIVNDQATKLLDAVRKLPDISAKELKHVLWVTRVRTQTVARTETNRWFEFAFKAWNEAAGEEFFIWVTCRDERVRHKHRLLDGKVFRWDTGAADGILPGQEINCRCKALPASVDLT